jgi:hypothetical protein
MEAICSSKTPVDNQRTARRYIPEDDTLENFLILIIKQALPKLLLSEPCTS